MDKSPSGYQFTPLTQGATGGGWVRTVTQKQFYKSRAWLRARQAYIQYRISVDGGLCETCHQELGYIVHHKIWLNDENCNDPGIALNFDNFKYDCLVCHNREVDPSKLTPGGRIAYGPNGEIIKKGDY